MVEDRDADEHVAGRLCKAPIPRGRHADLDSRNEVAAPHRRQPPHQRAESGVIDVVEFLDLGRPQCELTGIVTGRPRDAQGAEHGPASARIIGAHVEQRAHDVGEIVPTEEEELRRWSAEPPGEVTRPERTRQEHRRSPVVGLALEADRVALDGGAARVIDRKMGERRDPFRVGPRRGSVLATLVEPVEGERAHGLQQPEADPVRSGVGRDHAPGDEAGDQPRCRFVVGAHRPPDVDRRVEFESVREHRHPLEEALFGGVEQPVRPVDGGPHGSMAVSGSRSMALQDVEPLIEQPDDRRRAECGDARGDEFDRQRKAVEPAADQPGIAVIDHAGRNARRAGALMEQFDGARRRIERRHRRHALAVDAERLAAGRDHRQVRTRGEQRVERRRGGLDEMLAVVDDEQHRLGRQNRSRRRERFWRGSRIQHPGDRARHIIGVRHVGEVDEPDPSKARGRFGGDLDGETRLADAAHARERDQAVEPEQFNASRDLTGPSDQ